MPQMNPLSGTRKPFKCLLRIALFAMAAAVLAASSAHGQGRQGPDWSLDLGAQSAYVFRGQVIVDDWVLQPRLMVVDGAWYFDFWANMDLTDERGQEQKFTEWRFNSSYVRQVADQWWFGAGYTYYKFPNLKTPSTQEFFLSLQRRDILLQPKLTLYRDIDENKFTYASLGLVYSFSPPMLQRRKTGLQITSIISYGDKEFNELTFQQLDDGITDWTITAAMPLQSSSWTGYRLVPSVSYMRIVDEDLLDNNNREREVWWFGVTLQWGF